VDRFTSEQIAEIKDGVLDVWSSRIDCIVAIFPLGWFFKAWRDACYSFDTFCWETSS
jgi:hypothetical protein